MQPRYLSVLIVVLFVAGMTSAAAHGERSGSTAAPIVARGETQPVAGGEPGTAIVVGDAGHPARTRFVATATSGGLEVYDLQGRRLGATPAGEAVSVDVAYDIALGRGSATVLAAIDSSAHRLRLYTMQASTLSDVTARDIALGFAAEGVCLYRNPRDGALHAFVVGDGGEIDHQLVYATAGGKLDARQVRRINVPSTLKQCVVSTDGQLYASEETVGIWRFNADPEAYTAPALVDSPLLGKLDEEVGGLAVHDGGDGSRWLIASVASAGHLTVYDRSNGDRYVGAFAIAASGVGEAIKEPGPLFATSIAAGKVFPRGMLLVTDEDAGNFKMVSIADIAQVLDLAPGTAQDARARDASSLPAVTATVETVPVASFGDAADDPAIWADPSNPGNSLVVATDKKAGIYLHDMQGKVLQFVPDGKVNNVDLRQGFVLGGEKIVLLTATNRSDQSISIFKLDTQARRLVDIAEGTQPTGLGDPYGLCMHRAGDGRTYVFVNGDDTRKRQWELVDAGNGRVRAVHLRDMTFDSQTEGCVVDDATAALYVDEEDVGLWRLSAAPDGGDAKTIVERIAENPAVLDDYEGLGIYALGDGRGYIVVSSQGNDSYAVYRLEGRQEYLGSFAVVADPVLGIDGISETDGLEVTSRNLGPGFEHGAMIAQDGRNVMPVENQNYKVVPWESIARALKLEMRGD